MFDPPTRSQFDAMKSANMRLSENWAEDHTHLQNICRKHGATEQEAEGDEYGIPDIQSLADWLDRKIETLTAQQTALQTALEAYRKEIDALEMITPTKRGPGLADRTDYTTP